MVECGTVSADGLFDKYRDFIEEDRKERMLEEFRSLCPVHNDVLLEGIGCSQCYQESAGQASGASHPSKKQAWVRHPRQGKRAEQRADRPSSLLKNPDVRRVAPSAAKAVTENKASIAAVNCCATQKQEQSRVFRQTASALLVSLAALLVCPAAFGQTSYSGRGSGLGAAQMGAGVSVPLTYSARTDVCETGTETGPLGCAPNPTNPVNCPTCSGPTTALPLTFTGSPLHGVPGSNGLPIPGPSGTISSEIGSYCTSANPISQPTNNQYLCGIDTMVTDPDFHSQMTRATDYSLCGNLGCGFDMSSTSQQKFWASDSSKFFVQNTGGARALLAFNPSKWGQTPGPVTPSSIYGQSVLGNPAFSGVNPHVFYTFSNSNENVVIITGQTGTCQTLETLQQATTGATVEFLALNPSVLMVVGPAKGTADASHVWTGETSGCTVTPNSSYSPPITGQANMPNFNAIMQGTINDATQSDPTRWTVSYQMLFAFNYTAAMVGSPAASYFPTSATSCLPANYNANWNGTFQGSADDSTFSTPVSDNGQDTSWGLTGSGCASGGCSGPTLFVSFIQGHGCRVWNTHTDHVTGDDSSLPLGQMLDGQKNYIVGTIVGEPVLPSHPGLAGTGTQGALLTQAVTGATTEFKCKGNLVTGITPPSGTYTYSQFVCGGSSSNRMARGRHLRHARCDARLERRTWKFHYPHCSAATRPLLLPSPDA